MIRNTNNIIAVDIIYDNHNINIIFSYPNNQTESISLPLNNSNIKPDSIKSHILTILNNNKFISLTNIKTEIQNRINMNPHT